MTIFVSLRISDKATRSRIVGLDCALRKWFTGELYQKQRVSALLHLQQSSCPPKVMSYLWLHRYLGLNKGGHGADQAGGGDGGDDKDVGPLVVSINSS